MDNEATQHRLVGLTRAEMAQALEQAGIEPRHIRMRSQQIWRWIYGRGLSDFTQMSNIAVNLRGDLEQRFTLQRPEVADKQVSADGTIKWLLRFPRQEGEIRPAEAETVYIPEENRGTLCISCQVGCTLNCTFCHTGTQKLVRNLTAGEIVGQILIARDTLGEWPAGPDRRITNIVLMGMGEPLYNFEEIKKAIEIIADGEGLSISRRRITLSTAGVVPMIERCGKETGVMLAISLHGANDEVRDKLVPLNRKYPISQLMAACRNYPGLSNARRITFEYVMLKGVNDSLKDAKALVRLLKGIPAKINLIPFNGWEGSPYECSDWEQIERFAEVVNRAGYASPVRSPRGRDIMAACGQLKTASEKLRARARIKG
jgi:23S rRNA (adenine2503-C2)-methyltransferase